LTPCWLWKKNLKNINQNKNYKQCGITATMNMKVLRFLFLIFIILNINLDALKAQIAAPSFKCVKRDTLIWNLPTVSCGTISGYEIYTSRSINGPYQLLASINSPSQTRYFHNNTEGGNWFYYMETVANCAGQARLQSDTLDNQPPSVTSILTLNVVDPKTVEIRWRRNPSPEVVGYIIYKKTNSGVIPIANILYRDTVRYIDTQASPATKIEEYQVLAVDACGNTSLFDVNHSTILVGMTQNKCEQSILLRWNIYKNWANPIARQEIWIGVAGRIPTLFTSVGANDSIFLFKNVKNKTKYLFYIKAVESVTNISSKSNDTSLVANVLAPVNELVLKNVTVTPKNQVELTWRWNGGASIDSFHILRHRTDSSWEVIFKGKSSFPLDEEVYFTDTKISPSSRKYYYKIETIDECKNHRNSNSMSTLFMIAVPQTIAKNRIRWEPFTGDSFVVKNYQNYRIVRGLATAVGTQIDPTMPLEYIDITTVGEPEICYRVAVNYRYKLADGSFEDATSYSQTTCLAQYTNVFMPNAFTPGGANPEFKPVFTFKENITEYAMYILDRWGSILFETKVPTDGWDGTRNGKELPQGTYTYIVRLKQASGGLREEKGVLLLLR
jgi:gliding motility-associated-like protein